MISLTGVRGGGGCYDLIDCGKRGQGYILTDWGIGGGVAVVQLQICINAKDMHPFFHVLNTRSQYYYILLLYFKSVSMPTCKTLTLFF